MNINRTRSKFVHTIREVTVYHEQDESFTDDGDDRQVSKGTVFHIADETAKKTLGEKRVEVILFTIGSSDGWFWMPKREFLQSTEPA